MITMVCEYPAATVTVTVRVVRVRVGVRVTCRHGLHVLVNHLLEFIDGHSLARTIPELTELVVTRGPQTAIEGARVRVRVRARVRVTVRVGVRLTTCRLS